MIEWSDIVQIMEDRRAARSPLLSMMLAVRDRYEADYVIPDPSGATDEPSPLLTPALIAEAVDAPALRAASVLPNVYVPALDPAKTRSVNNALRRRGAILGTWHDSKLPLMLRRAFRHLRAYDTACFIVVPDFNTNMPKIQLRDPLNAFPEPKMPEDVSLPGNAGFIFGKSADWIRYSYPTSRQEHGGPIPASGRNSGDELWDMVEWYDPDSYVVGLLGPRYRGEMFREGRESGPVSADMELFRSENKAGCVPVVCPATVTLSQVSSQVARIIGHVDLQGQIMALEVAAIQKGIWPDRYILGKGNSAPQVVGGKWKEGATGEVNVVLDASMIGELRGSPDPSAMQLEDRLERAARISTGLVPQMGGETYGALRTGRGIDTLGSWAVDPRVQELQELMGFALESVNYAVLKTFTGYFGARKFTLFTGLGGGGSFTEVTPNKHIAEDCHSKVSYAIAGADKQSTTVQLAQQIGAKLISHQSARQKHPDIDDAELEGRRIIEEQLDEALSISILQRAAAPDSPGAIVPEDVAKIRNALREGSTLDEAVLAVNKARAEIQARAAEGVPQSAEDVMPGMAGPMEGSSGGPMEMGMGMGGPNDRMGGPQTIHSPENPGMGVEGPPAALDRFRRLASALRATSARS